ncbi:MAG: hypothetical protein IPM48_07420 [Saprospiraceae bacterium]|nr:hypothetical protein [Saprospiraceae bacterium]
MQHLIELKYVFILAMLLTCSVSLGQNIKSDFSHVEIVLDSASFEKLVANDFIKNKLASCIYDTMLLSPLVLSYYINGQNNFIHFNPSRGYFATQRGTAYLIFQTRRPGQGKLLEQQWRMVAKDSIVSYDFVGSDFTLTEIVYNHHDRLSNKLDNHLIPMLSSYSVESFRKWGLGDSVEVSVKQFLSSSISKNKLFEKIVSIELAISQKELRDLIPVLELVGYRKKKNKFIKPNEPTISYIISNQLNEPKIKKLTLVLTEDVGNQNFDFGGVIFTIVKNRAQFIF